MALWSPGSISVFMSWSPSAEGTDGAPSEAFRGALATTLGRRTLIVMSNNITRVASNAILTAAMLTSGRSMQWVTVEKVLGL